MDSLRQLWKGFTPQPFCQAEVEERLAQDAQRACRLASLLMMAGQAVMMIIFLFKSGGPFASMRRGGYFLLYAILFVCSLGVWLFGRRARARMRLAMCYDLLLCAWACGVTLLDQIGGNGLIVYSYTLLTIAALTVLRPRASCALFGGSFVLLNLCLPFLPGGVHNLFSNLINSAFVTLLSVFLSLRHYRGITALYCDQAVIQKQYEEIQSMNRDLQYLTQMDPLTQIHNRRYLEEQMAGLFAGDGSAAELAAGFMLDIDRFKEYNDRYGHQAGDRCLAAIARELQAFADREGGYAARYGGEEFFILVPRCEQMRARQIGEALRKAVYQRRIARDDGSADRVTISIGICVGPLGAPMNLAEFVRRADQALYSAKANGRDRVELFQTPEPSAR